MINAVDTMVKRTTGKARKENYSILWQAPKSVENKKSSYRMIADRARNDSYLASLLECVDVDAREVLAFLPEHYAPHIADIIGLAMTLADYRNKSVRDCIISLLYQAKKYRTRLAVRPTLADSMIYIRDYVETRSNYGYTGKETTATRNGKREYHRFTDLDTIADIIGKDDAESIRVELRETARATVAHWRASLDSATLARVEKFLGLDARKINDGIGIDRITGELTNYSAKNRKSAERIARLARMMIPEFSNATTADIIKTISIYW